MFPYSSKFVVDLAYLLKKWLSDTIDKRNKSLIHTIDLNEVHGREGMCIMCQKLALLPFGNLKNVFSNID